MIKYHKHHFIIKIKTEKVFQFFTVVFLFLIRTSVSVSFYRETRSITIFFIFLFMILTLDSYKRYW